MSTVGFSDLLWFIGKVEYVDDRTNSGRVKVRAFGIHPPPPEENGGQTGEDGNSTRPSPNIVRTEDLPWAMVIRNMGNSFQAILEEEDWVFGFFLDGRDAQHPFVLGTIPGINLDVPAGLGVEGASGWTRATQAAVDRFGRAPSNPHLTGEDLDTTPAVTQAATDRPSVPTAHGDSGWVEPPTIIPSRDLRTTVVESIEENGEGTVIAANPNFVTIAHRTGSVVQIDNNGTIKIKSLADNVSVAEGFQRIVSGADVDITGDENINIRANRGGYRLWTNSDIDVECENYNLVVRGKMTVNVSDGIEMRGSTFALHAMQDNFNIFADQKLKMYAGDITTLQAGSDLFVNVAEAHISTSDFYLTANGTMDIGASDSLALHSTGGTIGLKGQNFRGQATDGSVDLLASEDVNIDGTNAYVQSTKASGSADAMEATITEEIAIVPVMDETPAKRPSSGNQSTGTRRAAPQGFARQIVDDDDNNPYSGTVQTRTSRPQQMTQARINEILSGPEVEQARASAEEFLDRALSDTEWDNLMAAVVAEAATNSPEEQANVMGVILNRVRTGFNGATTVTDVLTQTAQFQAVTGVYDRELGAWTGPSDNFLNPARSQLASTVTGVNDYLSSVPKTWLNFTSNNPDAYGPGTNIGFIQQVANDPTSRVIGQSIFGTARG